ncbi:MAG: DUF1631 domain-containing protein [Sulfuriferula multivorans]|uniref:DUF1631 domain-containing protein n=1 Tax=Sulfuriferula multivorans TaxID=1559896 RepID=A0A7C9NRD9_9PROT|nr:DUF1631 domain-containing protein [Sulfuriferula multivorans]
MSDNSVVVNLNQYERSRRPQVSAETLAMLHGSRDLLIEGATRALTRQTEAMENALMAMAERSPLLETRNAYYSAQGLLSKQPNELLSACKDAYYRAFDKLTNASEKPAGGELLELSLIGAQDFELTLAIDKATSRLRYNCAEEMVALDARVGHIVSRPDLAENDNPLGPRVLCSALLDGFASMLLPQNAQVVLLNQFDLVLTTELAQIYQSINQYLVDRRILPDLKIGLKSRPRNTANPTHGGASGNVAASGNLDSSQGESGNVMFRMFEQLARGNSGQTSGGRSAGGAGDSGLSGLNLLDSLTQLQMGSLMLPDGGRFELPLLEVATIHNVLRSLQQSPVMQTATPLDAVLVDAVAMLFDVVFEDAAIPDHLKAQIARLQIPVLKAAMLDRNFFSKPNHPVRRMLDAIATLSVHLPDNDAGNARLEVISEIVSRVIDDFEKDVAVFDLAAAELEELGSKLEVALDETADVSLQPEIAQIKRLERTELAPVIVHDFINRALKDQPVAEAAREFLRRDWAHLLTSDYVSEGELGAHFNSHVETMRELVWSVQPKVDMDARLMLVRILPGLLKRLREGVAEIELPSKLCDRFFANLVILHANAVRPNAEPVPLPEMTPEEIEGIAAITTSDIPASVASAPESAAEPEIEDESTQQARGLSKGEWIEFHYDDGTFRWARLGWVGGVKNTYLFSDQDGMNSFSISLSRLADKLRRGEAVLVERKSITESAFGKLMKLFRNKLGHA